MRLLTWPLHFGTRKAGNTHKKENQKLAISARFHIFQHFALTLSRLTDALKSCLWWAHSWPFSTEACPITRDTLAISLLTRCCTLPKASVRGRSRHRDCCPRGPLVPPAIGGCASVPTDGALGLTSTLLRKTSIVPARHRPRRRGLPDIYGQRECSGRKWHLEHC